MTHLPPDSPLAKYETHPLLLQAKHSMVGGKDRDGCTPVEIPIDKTPLLEFEDWQPDPPKPKDVNTFSGREWFMVLIILGLAASLVMLTMAVPG